MSERVYQAITELLKRDTGQRELARETISHIMDLLYYGEFKIFEQVASSMNGEQVNLVGVKGQSSQSPLWLISELGTGALPEPNKWSRTGGEPYAPRIDRSAGMLWGHGACRGKVDLILKLIAASRFRGEELARPVHVIGLYGEGNGPSNLHSLLAHQRIAPGAALIGAPTNLEIWGEQPGCITINLTLTRRLRHRRMRAFRGMYELSYTGRSGHIQYPSGSHDALQTGLEILASLRKAGDVRLLVFDAGDGATQIPSRCMMQVATSYEQLPELPTEVTVHAIDDGASVPFPIDSLFAAWHKALNRGRSAALETSGVRRNRFGARPTHESYTSQLKTKRDAVQGSITFWTGPGASTRELVETFAQAAQQALIGQDEIEISLEVTQDLPARVVVDDDTGFLACTKQALREHHLPPVVSRARCASDAGLLSQQTCALVFGPGGGPQHLYRDDEGVPLVHLTKALAVYESIIRAWCTQPEIPSLKGR